MAYKSLRNELDFKHKLRDPIYGFIPLTDLELSIIDTPIFQRLRRVHQLALTKYVYPSAEHSRFVHSIGVMHCATLIYEGIFNHEYTSENRFLEPTAEKIQSLRLAALLHDVGHVAFSHAAEEVLLPDGIDHEDLSGAIIMNYEPIRGSIIRESLNPAEIASLLTNTPTAKWRLEHDILSGNLDADRADYLLRDSHSCGVGYGEYDFARFSNMFAAIVNEEDRQYSVGVAENDLWLAESLLISRYHYNMQVPYHRTRGGYDIVLRKFLTDEEFPKIAEKDEIGQVKGLDYEQFEKFDDYSVFERAKASKSPWADYLFRQKHLHPVVDTTSHRENGIRHFADSVEKMKAAGFQEDEDFFLQMRKVEILKEHTASGESRMRAEDDSALPLGGIDLIRKNRKRVDICKDSWIFVNSVIIHCKYLGSM